MGEYNHRECEDTMDSDAYAVHVNAMTAEGLHRKSEIALELAARDNRIAELEAKVERLVSRGIEDRLHRIAELEAERDGYAKNAAFFRCCALSGEQPKDGSEPYSPGIGAEE